METVERDYAPKGVKFYFVYKALAHPEWDGYIQPFTLEERLMQVAEAKRTLHSSFTWIVDAMDNRMKHAMGSRPDSEFVFDPNGVIVRARDWSDPKELRKDLETLVGPVDNPTTIADLEYVYEPPPMVAAKGVIPRLKKPGRMSALTLKPTWSKGGEPWYAKLRAEADQSLLENGAGMLYLGFRLDPVYHVHWNNLDADAILVKLETADGVTLSKTLLKGPQVDVPADIDPREFMIQVKGMKKETPITLSVSYFACNDEKGWCKSVEQKYSIVLERNADGGRVFPDRMNTMFNERIGRKTGKKISAADVDIDSRLPGTPPRSMVDRMNNRSRRGQKKPPPQ